MPEYVFDTSQAPKTWRILDAFTRGYIVCAMWTMTDEDGDSCDDLGLHDIAPETIAAAESECAMFQASYRSLLDATGCTDDEQHGHDLWLTRNGHGTGFWDRGYDEDIARALTNASKVYGERSWYIGDNSRVYQA